MRPQTREGSAISSDCCATWAYDPTDLMVLELSVADRDAFGAFGWPL